MPTYSVRQATEEDIPALVDFNCGIAAETEDKQLDRELVTRGVTRALQQGEEAVYFVAVTKGDEANAAIASLMLTREWSDWRDGWMAWIQSVYVDQHHRGNGIFTLLLQHATEELKKNPDVRGLRLYVENDNTRAQSVYHNNGFIDPHYKVLEKMF
ncbi:MAG: N-acetyltransferase [Planctomycetota bacterium]|nr:N-acetyltransferase [Planctomycetota bacterium]